MCHRLYMYCVGYTYNRHGLFNYFVVDVLPVLLLLLTLLWWRYAIKQMYPRTIVAIANSVFVTHV